MGEHCPVVWSVAAIFGANCLSRHDQSAWIVRVHGGRMSATGRPSYHMLLRKCLTLSIDQFRESVKRERGQFWATCPQHMQGNRFIARAAPAL
jgi:hypothetical protein